MSFMLRIAAAPDPSIRDATVPERVAAETPSIVSIEASGLMDFAGSDRLFGECRRLFAEGADTIVIECGDLSIENEDVRSRFADAIVSERALTHHVFVRSDAPALHAFLTACRDATSWLMPLGGTDAQLPRRNFDARSPLQP